jgi:3-methyl-2-oxobutanoate hydroxymethyltransferase
MPKKKLMIQDFYKMKAEGKKICWLTSYDFPTAQFAENAGMDMLLVGDSLGMCVYGYSSTIPVTMEQCLVHSDAVRRGAPNTFVVGDMPFLSYQTSIPDAVHNAGRFLKEAGVDAVKLEGGLRVTRQIEAITDGGIVVIGHIGLTPQSSGQLGGHKAQGRTAESARMVVADALAVEKAGAKMLLVEAVPPEITALITKELAIPVLSIGAGPDCDGQLLIVSDLIGQFQAFTPKFVKRYCNVAEMVTRAMKEYCDDVRSGRFPGEEHCYRMVEGEYEKFMAIKKDS